MRDHALILWVGFLFSFVSLCLCGCLFVTDRDIVSDIITRLAESLGADVVPVEVLQRIEVEIRRDWAGDTVYVKADRFRARNAEIIESWRKGMSIGRLAATYGLSDRRIRQIINTRKAKDK